MRSPEQANSTIAILGKPPKRISKTKELFSANGFSAILKPGTPAFVKVLRPWVEKMFAGVPEKRLIYTRVTVLTPVIWPCAT